ncbi:aminodeoxychorismate lyase [Pseudoteredinibacter isoporae]|uniref:Aminodeoxychorismate lyase n=1 Tax=Pseudoteredinibacter isoporae TaxID=570281 RepID=A0A7X0MW14_9GAMM|nr:aminodeoxychorismate lyase [Pseudoteredinibacter isoporae]MBB6521958.1 4-amino-4-deoxychorismate lyase [Pseudoteredinibacter isoporae]NHO87494.1 aminodeoxychorismate lyase [Pseudoteredinibacter isoporae]NIB24175.1 aminodeoxychorismate lyase [Pseudoteredinibacter isoporae]
MSQSALICRVNGRDAEQLSLFDRGFQFGDSLFETSRFYHGRCPLWSYHIERMQLGCQRLGIEFPKALLNAEYELLCRQLEEQGQCDAVLKFQLSRGESLRGYGAVQGQSNLIALAFSAESFEQSVPEKSLEISSIALARQPLLAGLKHGNRLEQVLARQQLSDNCDDALLLDTEQRVIEAISSNIFVLREGRWLTPDLSESGVAGVVRAVLLDAGAVTIAEIEVADVYQADALCLANSVQGIQIVKRLAASERFETKERHWENLGASEYLSRIYRERFTLS